METLTNQPQQKMTFDQLVQGILQLDTSLRDSTVKAINRMQRCATGLSALIS